MKSDRKRRAATPRRRRCVVQQSGRASDSLSSRFPCINETRLEPAACSQSPKRRRR
jgi:hypothetical protein